MFAYFAFKHIKSKTLVLVLGAVAAIALYAFAGISGRESGGAAEDGIDASAMGRLYAWEAAFKMALHHPFTGVGLDNFYFNYYFYSPHWDGINHAVHSTWFGVLAETGFVGLAVFITLIVSLIRTSLKSISLLTPDSDYPLTVGANAVLSALSAPLSRVRFLLKALLGQSTSLPRSPWWSVVSFNLIVKMRNPNPFILTTIQLAVFKG